MKKITNKQLRDFGLLIGIGLPVFIGWILPSIFGDEFRIWTLYIGIPGLILGLVAPRLLLYPFKTWMALGHALGWINSRLVLGIVFIFVLLPISFFMRILGYDPLRLKRKGKKTYRETRKNNRIDLTRTF